MAGARVHLVFSTTMLLMLSGICCLELDSFLLAAMDDTMLAMESERASLNFTKRVVVSEHIEKPVTTYKKKTSRKWRMRAGSRRRRGGSGLRKRPSSTGGVGVMSFSVTSGDSYTPGLELTPSITDGRWEFKPMLKMVKKTKVLKVSRNKNLHAMNQILNGMMEAGAMGRGIKLDKIQKQLIDACYANQYVVARKMTGHNIYSMRKAVKGQRSRRSVMSTKQIFSIIRTKIGEEKYTRLMAEDGRVTLAFVLDTTGSMGDDIASAKGIIKRIVKEKAQSSVVDYILSTFNDPESHPYHGNVEFMDGSKRDEFLTFVNNVNVADGDDCDELAISGIRAVYGFGVEEGSPIYVLTDAGAKDASEDNLLALEIMAFESRTPINFFLSNAGCLKESGISIYKSLAESTGGQILYFSDKTQVASTKDLIQQGLIGGSSVPVIPVDLPNNGRKRRGTVAVEFSITVDDTMDVLSTTIMDRSTVDAKLYNPAGVLETKGKINTGHGALFLVTKPALGAWKIVCESCSSDSYIASNAISLENIDFTYKFLVAVKVRRRSKVISSTYPVPGKDSTVLITVPAHKKTQPSSYNLQVVDGALKTLRIISLKQYGRAPGRYKGSFPTPSNGFRLVLTGKTKRNRPFKRLGIGIIKAKSAVIHLFTAPKGLSLRPDGKSTTFLIFALHCYGARELYDVKVHEPKKFTVVKPRRLNCIPNRMSMFPVSFRAPSSAKKGKIHNVVVTVIGQRSGVKASKHIQLLIA